MKTTDISNSDDTIDSRDVIARIEELEAERDAFDEAQAERATENGDETGAAWADVYEAEADELKALKALAEEAEGYSSDWRHGETLIRDSYFVEYAEQLAEDIGAIDRDASWPLSHIDWDAAADELKQAYTSVDFDGVTYWIR